jgi:hypothetical protein
MADGRRVILEVGTNERRVVAGATDWRGLDRWGRTDVMDHAWEMEDGDLS